MKRLTALFLGFVLLFSLAACSGENSASSATTASAESSGPATSSAVQNSSESEAAEPEISEPVTSEPVASEQETSEPETSELENSEVSTEAAGSNTLVVYFSATGNTAKAANYIAEITGGDLFELEPVVPYTDEDLNYNNEESRVSQEHEDESLRDIELVADTVDNWDSYDTVFIGYPVWWGIAAWPVDSFVEANDFTGKTVIPFCTSASSGLGESGQLLADLAGTGTWQEGMRFRSSVSLEDVQDWLDSINLS